MGTTPNRDDLIDFATWLSEQAEIDVATPDEAVDMFLGQRKPYPAFRLVHTANVGTVTECPHCGGVNTIVEVDSAIRFNELDFDDRSGGTRPLAHMGPEGDWDFDHWYCESCGSSDLSAPAQLDIREWV